MNKKMIVAVVVVVALIAVVAGVFLLKGEKEDPNKVTFLMQDADGVHFWTDGTGETTMDALKDAFSDYPEGTLTANDGWIDSIFGIGMVQDGQKWYYWMQYSWVDGSWTYNQKGMGEIMSSDVDYMLVIYGTSGADMSDNTVPPGTPVPDDAIVWDGKTTGTVFTIAAESGLYFKVNGSGDSLIDAFGKTCDKYRIPLEKSHSPTMGDGIYALFGIERIQDADGNWAYWSQHVVEDGKWKGSSKGMSSLKCEDNPVFLIWFKTSPGLFSDIIYKVTFKVFLIWFKTSPGSVPDFPV
ncbi:MAG: hypothetical protein LBU30_03045 [Candidatus Methanoplasma sp.]|nr:hypothetical protein [Candidatus Methanoplasma sp.]